MITIYNLETGEVIEREMNEAELAQQQIDQAVAAAEAAEAAAKYTARQAILDRLGITADEAAILLG